MGRPREPWKRERLLDAAMVAMRERGIGSLTVKGVASSAGVSPATVHYHFEDLEGLMVGVFERATDEMYTQRLAAIDAEPDIARKLDTLIELGVPDELAPSVALLYDAIAVLRDQPRFRDLTKAYVERQVGLYRAVIDAGRHVGLFTHRGSSDAVARNLLALEDAYCLYITIGVARDGVAGRAAMRDYLRATLHEPIPQEGRS
jgi:AcrR family transcriptional regulator